MTERQRIQTEAAPAAVGPYSQAIAAAGLVFCAGQGGLDPASGRVIEGGVSAEADQALRNLAAVLAAAGSGLDRVVKVTIFLAEIGDFAAVNEVYRRHFSEPYPARTTLAVRDLPLGLQVEIECIALSGGEPAS